MRDIVTGFKIQAGYGFANPYNCYNNPFINISTPPINFNYNISNIGYNDFNIDNSCFDSNYAISGTGININPQINVFDSYCSGPETSLFINNFQQPQLNNNFFNIDSYQSPKIQDNFTVQSIRLPLAETISNYQSNTVSEPKGKHDLEWWKAQGYDEEMGKKLGEDACKYSKHDPHQCSGYTRRTLNRLYGTNFSNGGPAYLFGNNILSDPKLKGKFKKINVKNLKNGEFPEGAIVIWYPGTPGYTKSAAARLGHVATVHNNKGYANGAVVNLSTYSEVWIPVKQA